ncbi:MAG: hypothetical protein CVV44_09735 [Spirochaetae bacterium HGW-Spirochaetae-1]|jgi:hypothetical protein|nr:MAG: hypothetical protein CVV44_09735 [Spirochaetae bacterium HGW-Spirochaetae-1]
MDKSYHGACIPLLMIIVMTMFACSGKDLRNARRYEGVKGDTLRVCVRETAVDEDLEKDSVQHRKQVLELGKKRAVALLIGHLRITYTALADAGAVEKKIIEALEKGTIIAIECKEDWCESFIDFPLKDIIDEAEKQAAGNGTK